MFYPKKSNLTTFLLLSLIVLALAITTACNNQVPPTIGPDNNTKVAATEITQSPSVSSTTATADTTDATTQASPENNPTQVAEASAATNTPTATPNSIGSSPLATPPPGSLQVDVVRPSPGANVTQHNPTIMVFFNKPVVPLTDLESSANLPNPLIINPPVNGTGTWIDSSTYQFKVASSGYRRGTVYTVRIPAGLTDSAAKAKLVNDFEWQFTVAAPTATRTPKPTPTPKPFGVTKVFPRNKESLVSPFTKITLSFNRQVYRQQAETLFSLINTTTSQAVDGVFTWRNGLELSFQPTLMLDTETVYRIELESGLESEFGEEQTTRKLISTFTTSPAPGVRSSWPEGVIDPGDEIEINFKTSMNTGSIRLNKNLFISPPISTTDARLNWNYDNTTLKLKLPLEFSQHYTVTLGANITDKHGLILGEAYSASWKTKAQAALLFIEAADPVATYSAYTETTMLVTARNIGYIDFALYHLPLTDFISINQDWDEAWPNYEPDYTNLVKTWRFQTDLPLDTKHLFPINLAQSSELGATLPPGMYYLEANVSDKALYDETEWSSNADEHERQIIIVSKYNVTYKESNTEALAWITDLQQGQPISNLPVSFFSGERRLGPVQTDETGVAKMFFGTEDREPLRFAIVGDPEAQDEQFAIGLNRWTQGIKLHDFNNIYVENQQNLYYGYFYTHRNLYRPAETVYFKGIIRRNDDAHYELPTAINTATVTIYDAQHKEIFRQDLPLNEMGTVNGTLKLSKDAALGDYSIEAYYAGQSFYDSFSVAAYRLPEFKLEVTTDQAQYTHGDTITVTANAEYFFGQALSNAEVRWTLFSTDFSRYAEGLNAYDFLNESYEEQDKDTEQYGFGRKVADGTGQTDKDGNITFAIPADTTARRTAQLYTVDVVVTDSNNQEVAVQASVLVYKSRFLVGLKPQKLVSNVNTENTMNVLVVDWAGDPIINQPVELILAKYNRYSVQVKDPEQSYYSWQDSYYWRTTNEEIPLITTTVTTDENGTAILPFTPEEAGIYKMNATVKDLKRGSVRTSTFVWVSGPAYVNWGQQNQDRFELLADKPSYQVGETANILVPHPFSGTTVALVTLERGHIYEHFVTELSNNSQQIQIPITEAMLPNMYVSVVVVKGVDEYSPWPAFNLAYINLPINPQEKNLNITMTPNKEASETYQPGETVAYNIQVTNAQGQPIKTELSLALVDQAILSLAPHTPGQLLKEFWNRRGLGVQTASSLTLAMDRFNDNIRKTKGGDGCADCEGLALKGFGKTRGNFLDTALWIADFITDENGQGYVEATLPDNLTTWTLTGIGVTGADTHVGENTANIITTKPLIVRPITPRFFVIGDQAQIGLIVQNSLDDAIEVEVTFEASGLTLGQWRIENGPWQDPVASTRITVPGQGKVQLQYQTVADKVQAAQLTMRALGSQYSDALTFNLPIYNVGTPETMGTNGILIEDGERTEIIQLPDDYDPNRGNLTVEVAPSLAAAMKNGLEYLEHYPYECTEQSMSRFLPNVVTYQAYQHLNVENPKLAERLPDLVSIGLQKLYNHHHTDGGWGWWTNDPSDINMTAYVVQGLLETKKAGFIVDETVLSQGLAYLEDELVAPDELKQRYSANQQAYILYVLALGGQGDLGRSVALFDNRESLDLYAKAYLALALHLLDPGATQIEALIDEFVDQADITATSVQWKEVYIDYAGMNTSTRSTAIIIAALSQIDPTNPLLPKAIRWLMNGRQARGYWGTTQETAWAIIGLTKWMLATGELNGNYQWQVTVNDTVMGEGNITPNNIDQTTTLQLEVGDLLADAANELTFKRSPMPNKSEASLGRLYYTAHLTYYVPTNQVEALNRGIKVSRTYRLKKDRFNKPTTEATVGDVIEVEVVVTAPEELYYVLVEDPIPAGTEAIDSSLAISSLAEESNQPNDDRHAFTHTELRDEKAVLFATYLRPGTYHYIYQVRATLAGQYNVLPVFAEQMYFPEVFGRSAGSTFSIANVE